MTKPSGEFSASVYSPLFASQLSPKRRYGSVHDSFRNRPLVLRVEHAEKHDALVDGDTQSGKLESNGIVLGNGEHLQSTPSIWKTLVGHWSAIDGEEGVANCGGRTKYHTAPHFLVDTICDFATASWLQRVSLEYVLPYMTWLSRALGVCGIYFRGTFSMTKL